MKLIIYTLLNHKNYCKNVAVNQYRVLLRNQNTSSTKKDDHFDFYDMNQSNRQNKDLIANLPDAEEEIEKEQKYVKFLEKNRQVSRFSTSGTFKKYHELLPITFSNKDDSFLRNVKYFRRYLVKYGQATGIEKNLAWPSRNELMNMIKEETDCDLTLNQKVKLLKDRKQNEFETLKKLYF
jgi:hypothetical protein